MRFYINIRLFADDGAGERTEKATPKKKRDVRKKGQVLQSREFSSAVVLLFVFLILKLTGKNIYNQLHAFVSRIFSDYVLLDGFYTTGTINGFYIDILLLFLKIKSL